ncbi:metal-dependent hydrolase family protein [Arenimonas fontis]|uniref:Amidohydrolase family protein n=1 Tax=Arenimonas fontis TaxID=2608255 RepID=A0A5B2ZC71_9GAMM|nr:amidohydrolase family protein [Arenimonas fontis]KAA2286278.1 amidohydrolase family protein [Arenimonas fontis]
MPKRPARTLPCLALSLALPGPALAERLALHCGQLFDAASGRLLAERTVLVEDGRIREVRTGLAAVEGARAVDLRGHTCSPGWIDLHVHLDGQSSPDSYSEGFRLNPEFTVLRSVGYARKTLHAGFTTVRDLGGETVLALRDAIDQGLVEGPRIHAAGKSIATTGGHADPTNGMSRELRHALGTPGPAEGVIDSPEEARQAVRQRYKEGSDLIKITATGGVLSYARSGDAPQFTVDEVRAVVETARDYGFHVAAHAHGKEGMRRAILGGVRTIEHGTYMDDEIFALMKKHGTWYVPTISAGRFVAEKAKEDGYYPEIVRPKAARIGAQIQATFARAHRAGVKIAFGTDAGVSYHGDNADEFVFMVEAGMSPAEALRTATVHAAEVLGAGDLGQLAAGFRADVVAVPGNPLEDISLTRKVDFVMKDGRIVLQPD